MRLKPQTALWVLAAAGLSGLIACSKPAAPPARTEAPPYNLSLDMKELMGHVIDPAAWVFWRASGEITSEKGEKSLTPTTEEGWTAAESGAAQVAEAGNLLMLPGRARDNGDWMKFARALAQQGLDAKAAAEAHDPKKMFETGAAIYQTCTGCHAKYVMPYLPKDNTKPAPLPDWPTDVRSKQAAFDSRKR